MSYLMGIDVGTSSLKTILIDESGTLISSASYVYSFSSPYSNFAEQDPKEWWEACKITIRKVLSDSLINPDEIKGLSFSGQMHGLVTLDANGNPVRPAILHCDARSGKQVEEIKQRYSQDEIRDKMLNPVYTGFLLPSLLWVKENEPDNFKKIRHVFLPKDYLKYKLSGVICSDYSDASATLAFDIQNMCWSEAIIADLQLNREWFPDVFETGETVGTVSHIAATQTGLSEKTCVVAGGGDQVMQQIGNGIIGLGQASANIGTSGQVSFQSEAPIINPNLNTNTFMGFGRNRWFTMGAIMNAGLCYDWFNSFFESTDYAAMNEAIEKVKPGSGGVIFLPYLNGERTPHLDPDLSSCYIGMNLQTGKPELARAVMEGVTFALYECMEICKGMGLVADSIVASGGGAKSMPWLKMQADIYNLPIRVADNEEQASLGAAIAAGAGSNVYASIPDGCKRIVKYKEMIVLPDASRHEAYMEYYDLYKKAFRDIRSTLKQVTLLGRENEKKR